MFQSLLFGNGLRLTNWHHLSLLKFGGIPLHTSSNGVLTVCSPNLALNHLASRQIRESTGQTQQIGEKGSKRHILIDKNGIPISLPSALPTSMTAWLWRLLFSPNLLVPGCMVRRQGGSRLWLHPIPRRKRRRLQIRVQGATMIGSILSKS